MATIDVPAWIEEQKISRTQILVVSLMTLTSALDGFDAQLIGYVAPAVIRDLHVAPQPRKRLPPAERPRSKRRGTTAVAVGRLHPFFDQDQCSCKFV